MSSDSEFSEDDSQDPVVDPNSSDESSRENEQSQESSQQLTGYELVADMMRRQDDVIAELDLLNLRIDTAIKDISDARKLEQQAAEGVVAEQEIANEPSGQEKQDCKAA